LDVRNTVILLYQSGYSDYGPTLYSEELASQHGLKIHAETLRRWLMDAGLWKAGVDGHRLCPHRKARPRRAAIGELLQLDGSTHNWFESRNPALLELTLLVLIDDASNRVSLRFEPSEDTQGVFTLLSDHCRRYGLPKAIYTDHGTVYWTDAPGQTQYQRAMRELGIETIYAKSAQAKGRVERSNRTFQDRLIKAMRQAGVSTIADANRFLDEHYTAQYNAMFRKGQDLPDVHRPVTEQIIERALSVEEDRFVRNDYTVLVARVRWQIEKPERGDRYLLPMPGARVKIRVYVDGSLHCFAGEQEVRVTRVIERNGREHIPGRTRTKGVKAAEMIRKRMDSLIVQEEAIT